MLLMLTVYVQHSVNDLKPCIFGSRVDAFCLHRSCVRLVTSQRSGMGKSLYIQRMVQELQMTLKSMGRTCVTVPLHGPEITPSAVMDYLEKHIQESACTIIHLDISPSVCSDE